MSTYPIQIVNLSLDHIGGTKSYHLLIAETADDRALLVKRWGKKNSFGQLDVAVGSIFDMKKRYFDILTAKQRGGYEHAENQKPTLKLHSFQEVKSRIGPILWTKLGAENVKFLMPDADTTGVKSPEVLSWKKNNEGDYSLIEKPSIKMLEKTQSVEEKIAANALWGLF